MVKFNGALYSYVHNLQGDIVGIVDSAGSLVVEYKYDAWGKPTLVRTLTTAYEALAELNPFRYRGYVYDEETELYYLRSRYYDFEKNRFISRDSLIGQPGETFKHNGYCYARNNLIAIADSNGHDSVHILYDGRPDESEGGKGFPNQAQWWEDVLINSGYDVTSEGFETIDEFIEDWNDAPSCDHLIIIAHGAEGTLDCNSERIGISTEAGSDRFPVEYTIDSLEPITVRKTTLLLTCHGATPGYDGISFADIVADLTQSVVGAAYYAKISYYKDTGYPRLSYREKSLIKTIRNCFRGKMIAVKPLGKTRKYR